MKTLNKLVKNLEQKNGVDADYTKSSFLITHLQPDLKILVRKNGLEYSYNTAPPPTINAATRKKNDSTTPPAQLYEKRRNTR